MFTYVLDFLLLAFKAVFGWFHSLLNVSSSMDAFLGVFFIAMTYRFLLAPFFDGGLGSGSFDGSDKAVGSDKAKASDKAKGRKKKDSSGG